MYDIDEIRRRAMGLLEKEAGGPVAAAKRAGMKYAQWANLRSGALDSKSGKPRGMRKETARKIEAAFGIVKNICVSLLTACLRIANNSS